MKAGARDSASGFTLIEILIVLFIISIVTTVALLSIGKNRNRELESFANDLSQTITLAEEQAMLQPAILGLTVRDSSVHFSALETGVTDKKNRWVAVDERALEKRNIPDDIQVDVEITGSKSADADENDAAKSVPQIIISTNGDITPFKIYVGRKGDRPRYLIKGEADGNVTNKSLS
jgi:general secretion pathway protein H